MQQEGGSRLARVEEKRRKESFVPIPSRPAMRRDVED